jgi:DNA-binding CsgD family transcriptional regulator
MLVVNILLKGESWRASNEAPLVKSTGIGHPQNMRRTLIVYAVVLGAAVFVCQWVESQYMARRVSTEIYALLIGVAFTVLGLWLGRVLTPQRQSNAFALNEAALRSLGITKREYAVLEQLASGLSNKEIAASLHVSPNTVKTHIARLYEKLEVGQRVQAVQKAKELHLIP